MKKYLNLFDFSQRVDYKTEVLSGLTVALALIPEAVAFAKREAYLKRLNSIELIDEVAAFAESLRGKVPMAIAIPDNAMMLASTPK